MERGRVRSQLAAHLTQAGAHLVNACLVDDGRGVLHRGAHARGEGLTSVGIAVDVGDDVGEAQIGQARVGGDRTGRVGRHVQDRPTGGGRVREDGRDDGGVIAVRGNVDEHAASVGGGLNRVLLGGNQVADALFRPGVTVGRVGDRSLGAQVVARVLVARKRADHLRVFEGCHVLGQAGGEGVSRVAEQTDHEVVSDLEARQGGAGITQGGHRLRRGEPVGSARLREDQVPIHVEAVAAQGLSQLGGEKAAASERNEHVVVATHEAHGAQQGGDGDGVGSVAPGGRADSQVDGACAVRGRTLLGARDDGPGALEGATQRNGFADQEAQADGVFRVELGEASGVRAGQGQRRQRRGVRGDVLVEA